MGMRDILDRQANSIEYVLHTHGIRAQVDGGRLSPRLVHFHVMIPPGVRASQLAPFVPEIADTLGLTSCRLAPAPDGGVYLEVPRPDPVPVRLLPVVQRVADVVPPITATLGLDTEGTPLLLRLNSPDVDPLLVSGEKSAGKSSLLRGMALSLALHNSPDRVRLLLLNGNIGDAPFRGLEGLPHLACPVANGPVESLLTLRWATRMLSRRVRTSGNAELLFDDDDAEEEQPFEHELGGEEPALVVMVDGADALLQMGNKRGDREAANLLNRLLSEGSRYDIHLTLATERLQALGSLEARWGARIAGTAASGEAARLATGVKGSGAQGLLGSGDFLVSLNAELIRFQAGAVSEAEVAKAVSLIRTNIRTPAQAPDEEMYTLNHNHAARGQQGSRRERAHEEPVQLRRSWSGQ